MEAPGQVLSLGAATSGLFPDRRPDVKRYELEAFLFLVAIGAGLWLWRFVRNRRATSAGKAPA